MEKDWTGNSHSVHTMNGNTGHACEEREVNDFYATDPKIVEMLLDLETFDHNIWEPAAGQKHISNVLEAHGYCVRSSDLIIRTEGVEQKDFLLNEEKWDGDVITNPPYKYVKEFVEKCMDMIPDGHKVAMYLKLQFLEGKAHRELFRKYPPKYIYVSTMRGGCGKNGEGFGGGAICFCWYIWEKGFTGEPTIRWFNDKKVKK